MLIYIRGFSYDSGHNADTSTLSRPRGACWVPSQQENVHNIMLPRSPTHPHLLPKPPHHATLTNPPACPSTHLCGAAAVAAGIRAAAARRHHGAPRQQPQPRHEDQNAYLQPGQEGALVGEERFGLNAGAHDGRGAARGT
jgi:hypothetical protein